MAVMTIYGILCDFCFLLHSRLSSNFTSIQDGRQDVKPVCVISFLIFYFIYFFCISKCDVESDKIACEASSKFMENRGS